MFESVLTKEQVKLLPLLKSFTKDFVLVGGTAVGLQIGHRRSVGFDLFSYQPFGNATLRQKIKMVASISKVLVDKKGELTLIVGSVKTTFFNYPFKITADQKLGDIVKMPDLATLAAMKAYALGRRAKWKDYVDLHFILKDYFSLNEVVKRGARIFGDEFNERLFRVQLAYFKDINHDEKIEFLPGFEVGNKQIEKTLSEMSME